MITSIVHYQIGSYSGSVEVTHEPDAENQEIIAKAKRILKAKAGDFPFGYQSWTIKRSKYE